MLARVKAEPNAGLSISLQERVAVDREAAVVDLSIGGPAVARTITRDGLAPVEFAKERLMSFILPEGSKISRAIEFLDRLVIGPLRAGVKVAGVLDPVSARCHPGEVDAKTFAAVEVRIEAQGLG